MAMRITWPIGHVKSSLYNFVFFTAKKPVKSFFGFFMGVSSYKNRYDVKNLPACLRPEESTPMNGINALYKKQNS